MACSLIGALLLGGCTVHPAGEREEREAVNQAGRPFAARFETRPPTTLPANPSPDDLVRAALLANADVEERYWAWRSALEQIPQDGTQPTMIRFFGGPDITRGDVSLAKTTLGVGSGTTANFIWPEKLAVAARRALEKARAAGQRFAQAKFALRERVLDAYFEFALTAELVRLNQSDASLLQTNIIVSGARNRAGMAGQADLLKAENELDLSRNSIARQQAQLPARRAAINALLSRPPDAPLPTPASFPVLPHSNLSDAQWLTLAAKQNPQLQALADDIHGGRQSIALARLQYYPNFAVSASTDLAGITQSLAGGVILPLLRFDSLDAAVRQAQSDLRGMEAVRRQYLNDLQARVVTDLATARDADRQIALFEHTILPRARAAVTIDRDAYETSHAALLELIDSERSLIAIEKLVAQLRVARAEQFADLETIAAVSDAACDGI